MDEQFLSQKLIALNEMMYQQGMLPRPDAQLYYVMTGHNQYALVWGTQTYKPMSLENTERKYFVCGGSFGQIIDFINDKLG